jgi:hypothetical protein
MLSAHHKDLQNETNNKLDLFHKAKAVKLVPGLAADTKFGQEIEGTIPSRLLSNSLNANLLSGSMFFNEIFKDIKDKPEAEAL